MYLYSVNKQMSEEDKLAQNYTCLFIAITCMILFIYTNDLYKMENLFLN